MNQKPLAELTDDELLKLAKKQKSTNIINAFIIGFLAGIVIYSIAVNTFGFLMIIPLFLAYKLINKSKYEREELKAQLKARNLS
ncbi:FUSC family protein [Fulvivirga lutea]|uniref:FUSC family protein n=1 Tax=Fulvivirga lutea TaxID=2810512 RepID=A0A974WKN6_9BACT|nr:FUSC family protein [Fulvivirga lutea]QSE98962.1 FUSC family protein [Fulvivirga lutea]